MSDRDDKAAEFYENEENLAPTGPARKRTGQSAKLSNHVPVRFDPALLQRIRRCAAEDQVSVSSWIRTTVQREVDRRLPETTTTFNPAPSQEIPTPAAESSTYVDHHRGHLTLVG